MISLHEANILRKDERSTETIESLIRRTHETLAATGTHVSPSKVSRVVRRYSHDFGSGVVASIIDGLVKPQLPTASESFLYDLQAINNVHATIPTGYAAIPAISRMRFGGDR